MTQVRLTSRQLQLYPSPLAISIQHLHVAYPNQKLILSDLNLAVRSGERVGVIGPNGAGKTTCFHSICGLLTPKSGSIEILGRPVMPGQFQPEVGLVFQNPDDQLFSASVWDDVAFGPENMGLTAPEVRQRVKQALWLTGTTDLIDQPPHHLSGGQKRMVAIAGILAMQPQVIIYDEPSANLDMRSRRRLIQFLQDSQGTLLIASHDLEFILEVCDRVIVLNKGRIVADGPCPIIMGNQSLMEANALEKPHSLTHHNPPGSHSSGSLS